MQKYLPVSVVEMVSLHLHEHVHFSCLLTSLADKESIPTIRCSICSEWHHRPCVSMSENDDQSFVCRPGLCEVQSVHTEPNERASDLFGYSTNDLETTHGSVSQPPSSINPTGNVSSVPRHALNELATTPPSDPLTLSQTDAGELANTTTTTIGHLALLNQHLAKAGSQVEWIYCNDPLAPVWNVKVMIDGEYFGRGRGNTKKAARNEAAREGLHKLGVVAR